jgi:hypothetical protein
MAKDVVPVGEQLWHEQRSNRRASVQHGCFLHQGLRDSGTPRGRQSNGPLQCQLWVHRLDPVPREYEVDEAPSKRGHGTANAANRHAVVVARAYQKVPVTVADEG